LVGVVAEAQTAKLENLVVQVAVAVLSEDLLVVLELRDKVPPEAMAQ
jgi:hypothetical protein